MFNVKHNIFFPFTSICVTPKFLDINCSSKEIMQQLKLSKQPLGDDSK